MISCILTIWYSWYTCSRRSSSCRRAWCWRRSSPSPRPSRSGLAGETSSGDACKRKGAAWALGRLMGWCLGSECARVSPCWCVVRRRIICSCCPAPKPRKRSADSRKYDWYAVVRRLDTNRSHSLVSSDHRYACRLRRSANASRTWKRCVGLGFGLDEPSNQISINKLSSAFITCTRDCYYFLDSEPNAPGTTSLCRLRRSGLSRRGTRGRSACRNERMSWSANDSKWVLRAMEWCGE